MKKRLFLGVLLALPFVRAHCPLCTVGAAAAAGGAAYLGVNQGAIGVFIGAFAVSMGWWMAGFLPWKHKMVRPGMIVLSFILTIVPMLAIMKSVYPVYISIIGEYGGFLNRTYVLNEFFWGALLGGGIVTMAPALSRTVTKWRGAQLPYQGITLTFVLLLAMAGLLQVIV